MIVNYGLALSLTRSIKSMQANIASQKNTKSIWKINLVYGQPIHIQAETKEEAKRYCLDRGIGIYSSPIKSIEKQ